MAGVWPRRDGHSSGTPVAGRLEQPTRATRPTDKARGRTRLSLLFGFAPGGACRAADVAACAVRSYRTLSPLPWTLIGRFRAVCFLWRFPWGRPRRTLSGAVSVWSPDFPPLESGGRPADWREWAYERWAAAVKEKRETPSPGLWPPGARQVLAKHSTVAPCPRRRVSGAA